MMGEMNAEQANRGELTYNLCLWDNFIHRLDMAQAHVFRHHSCAGIDLRFSLQFLLVVDFLKKDGSLLIGC